MDGRMASIAVSGYLVPAGATLATSRHRHEQRARKTSHTACRTTYTPHIGAMLAKWMSGIPDRETLKIFRTFPVHEDLAPRTGVLGAALLSHPRVTPREREIVIHRMTARCGAEYEWGVHTTLLGRPLGFTDEQMWALARGDAFNPLWDQRERLLIRLADDIYCTTNLSAALWDELVKHWKNDQQVELVITAGWYRTVSLLVNVSGVELEEWAERFPSLARANGADGRRRRSNMLRTQPMRCSPRCVGGLPDSPPRMTIAAKDQGGVSVHHAMMILVLKLAGASVI